MLPINRTLWRRNFIPTESHFEGEKERKKKREGEKREKRKKKREKREKIGSIFACREELRETFNL